MSNRILCSTLFDITQTGIMNRSKPNQDDVQSWILQRNTQCNFDTILQAISLRSQPDVIKIPNKMDLTRDKASLFGFIYKLSSEELPKHYWSFEFEVQHASVFEDGIVPLGALYKDCEGVPMLRSKEQNKIIPMFLDISSELKNIHFEVL